MHRLVFTGVEATQTALQLAIQHSAQGKYVHRLHCLLLVGAGSSCYEVAHWFGDDPRSVERWVHRFNRSGLDGLRDKVHVGRHPALGGSQMHELAATVGVPVGDTGPGTKVWNGTSLQREILQRFGMQLSTRQCRRLLTVLRTGSAR